VIALRFKKPEKLPELLRRDPAWMPPSLCIVHKAEVPDAEGQGTNGATGATGSTDLGDKWWLGSIAYANILFTMFLLMMVVPNGQWAGTHYEKFDGRMHVGLGGSSMCSGMFKETGAWAQPVGGCDASAACDSVSDQCADADFSDTAGANEYYEDSWDSCKGACSTLEWERFCMSLNCGGVHHQTQCRNVTKMVEPTYHVTYVDSSTVPWEAATSGGEQGDRCLPVEDICDNHAEIKKAVDCGVVTLVFVALAVLCMTIAGFVPKDFNLKLLGVTLASLVLSWILLLACLVSFQDVLDADATCIVSDVSDTGAVYGHGKFKDITRYDNKKGGMLGFRFLQPAIAFLSVGLFLVFHHVVDLLMPGQSAKSSVPQSAAIGEEQQKPFAAI